MGGMAEFERKLIRARCDEGIKRALARGTVFGRKSVLDAGEDAGLALSALKSGADMVRFSGAPALAQKLSQIARQMGVRLEIVSVIL